MIFDSHTHYDDESFDDDRDELLRSLPGNNIGRIVNMGNGLFSTKISMELAEKYPFVYAAAGVHPSEVEELDDDGMSFLSDCLKRPKTVALGEIGLDYHWDDVDKCLQKKWFEVQLLLAKEADMPVVIHSRDAAKDTMDMMKACGGADIAAVVHCFSYGIEIAREYLNMGYYIGVGGVLTFPNGRRLKEVVDFMPLERILLETDCPYLSPAPYRGKRNSSLNLKYVIKAISEIKGISEETVEQATWDNAVKFYRMED